MGIITLLLVALSLAPGPPVHRGPYGERELKQVSDRIVADHDLLAAAGLTLATIVVDRDAHVVKVELMTRRDDAADYFRDRYGPVTVDVIAADPTSDVRVPATGYEISSDTRLIVHWDSGGGAELVRVELAERADRVEVGVIERRWNGPTTADLRFASHDVVLSRPLGDRAVIDAATGRRLPVWRPER